MNRKSFAVKLIFCKKGELVFISHLDVMRLFQRAFRRTQLPLQYTQGFNPHIKLSFRRALGLGKESNNEEMIITLTERVELEAFKKTINKQLPKGIRVRKVEYNTTK